MGREKRFVSYCDIPLQHASKRVLEVMRRPGSAPEYRDMITRMRDLVPDIAIRTTFITGHPGETPHAFGELHDFVQWAEFDHLGVFCYSPEESTPAARMEMPSRKTAERRREKLMALQNEISTRRNAAKIGMTFDAIVTGVSAETEHLLQGRITGQAPDIDGMLFVNDGIENVRDFPFFAKVEITDAHPYDLVGGIVSHD
jgi:ribosomal protein S12 methylthiotransferase